MSEYMKLMCGTPGETVFMPPSFSRGGWGGEGVADPAIFNGGCI